MWGNSTQAGIKRKKKNKMTEMCEMCFLIKLWIMADILRWVKIILPAAPVFETHEMEQRQVLFFVDLLYFTGWKGA